MNINKFKKHHKYVKKYCNKIQNFILETYNEYCYINNISYDDDNFTLECVVNVDTHAYFDPGCIEILLKINTNNASEYNFKEVLYLDENISFKEFKELNKLRLIDLFKSIEKMEKRSLDTLFIIPNSNNICKKELDDV